ncbi:AI-2E family transporter [Hoeflea sp.]|uniref:AI-2E family transporter n=1 Tax=Hoeflea sp. TaxID=1940281 RepID=UPI001993EE88|nr:AI-2E family transporter [Hoeflea sp.]MBC7283544.1 AI-2E family transporter [Hoeflea sp.]
MDLRTPLPQPDLTTIKRVLIGIFIVLVAQVLFVAQDVVMPMVLGLLIAQTLRPIVRFADKRGINSAISAFLIIVFLAGGLGVGAYSLSGPISDLVSSAPETGLKIREKFAEYRDEIAAVKEASEQVETLTDGSSTDETQKVVVQQPPLLSAAASNAFVGLTTVVVALILAMFLLSTGTLFYEKIVGIMPLLSEKKRALRVIYDVERQVSRYLFTITLINAGLGVAIGTCLWLYGMPNPVMWGCIAAVLNFLPFIGAWGGALAVAATAMVVYPTLGAALVAPAIYLGFTILEGNFLTPMIVGRRLELNIVAVFLTVTVWGWLWGLLGALMAVPILVVVKVLCDNFESMSAFGQFLSGRPAIEEEVEVPAADSVD